MVVLYYCTIVLRLGRGELPRLLRLYTYSLPPSLALSAFGFDPELPKDPCHLHEFECLNYCFALVQDVPEVVSSPKVAEFLAS